MSSYPLKIALLGLGLENQALLNFWQKTNLEGEITICDQRGLKSLRPLIKNQKNIKYQLGVKFNKNLDRFDIIFRSPGWPLFCPGIIKAKKNKKTIVTSAMNLFFALAPTKNIIGVTGTKGKGTTSSLLAAVLRAAGKKVYLGGNIGIAPFSFINKLKPTDWVVLELSSFQLENLKYSPRFAVITNLYSEHLVAADPLNPNYHRNFKEYVKAKLNIAKFQTAKDYLIINKNCQETIKPYLSKLSGKKIYFSQSGLKSQLVADYNKENIAAAVSVAKILKLKNRDIARAIKNFKPLEHRLELVADKNKIKYYDNSFATTPESTILDLKAFKKSVILLAGGADKGADFTDLAKTIKTTVKYLILFSGAGTKRLKQALEKINFPKDKLIEVKSMETGVKLAALKAEAKDIVLLSTACASFGLFKNYKDRGNQFKFYVKKFSR